MKGKKLKIGLAVAALILLVSFVFFDKKAERVMMTATVRKGNFKDQVQCSGELQAEFSEDIKGPAGMGRFNIYEIKIENLIPEGTEVKKGDFICSLDKSTINSQLNEANVNLQKAQAILSRHEIDTAISLSQARVNIKNQTFEIEQKTLVLQQSKYEPPATIRQAELDLEKAKRELYRAKSDYILKRQQEISQIGTDNLEIKIQQDRIRELEEVQKSFIINAPKNGLLIYKKDWNGRKITTGTTINTWNPSVATLPDLSSLLTKTYINEVDIRKIKKDQHVQIGFDAFPKIKLTGKVISVANMGENQANSDSKVFEVMIRLQKLHPAIKPGMSTSNAILINELKDQVIVPLDAIFSEKNISYAYVKRGSKIDKQEIRIGLTNENEGVVLKGLGNNEQVYLAEPDEVKSDPIIRLKK